MPCYRRLMITRIKNSMVMLGCLTIGALATELYAMNADRGEISAVQSFFFDAVKSGDIGQVRGLLNAGAVIDARDQDEDGKTALMVAVKCHHVEMVRLLLRAGANSTVRDKWGSTVLDSGLMKNVILSEITALVTERRVIVDDNQDFAALMYTDLKELVGDYISLHDKQIKRENAKFKNQLLMGMIETENKKGIEWLLKAGVNVNGKCGSSGDTPLIKALSHYNGNTDMVGLLLKAKAHVDVQNTDQESVWKKLMEMRPLFDVAVLVDMLFKAIKPGPMKDEIGKKMLKDACRFRHFFSVEALLKAGVQWDNNYDNSDKVAWLYQIIKHIMHHASSSVRELLEVTADGKTSLVRAFKEDWSNPLIKKLIWSGVPVYIVVDDTYVNHCYTGARRDRDLIIDETRRFNEAMQMESRRFAANKQKAALIRAVVDGRIDTVEKLCARGVSVNTQSNKGWTPLMLAAKAGYNEMVDALVMAEGINFDVQNSDGDTVLMLATADNNMRVVGMLVAKGANVNIQNGKGETSLMRASLNGNKALVKYMVWKGALTDIYANNGKTVWDIACAQMSDFIKSEVGAAIRYMLTHGSDDIEGFRAMPADLKVIVADYAEMRPISQADEADRKEEEESAAVV